MNFLPLLLLCSHHQNQQIMPNSFRCEISVGFQTLLLLQVFCSLTFEDGAATLCFAMLQRLFIEWLMIFFSGKTIFLTGCLVCGFPKSTPYDMTDPAPLPRPNSLGNCMIKIIWHWTTSGRLPFKNSTVLFPSRDFVTFFPSFGIFQSIIV